MNVNLVSPTHVIFNDDVYHFTIEVFKLDDNNDWVSIHTNNVEAFTQSYSMSSDGIYHFRLTLDYEGGIISYGYLLYETIKRNIREYAKSILCSCCEKDCSPCDNEQIYDFMMMIHLSLAYLGANDYLMVTPFDPTDPVIQPDIEAINNAIVRTKKYILINDI